MGIKQVNMFFSFVLSIAHRIVLKKIIQHINKYLRQCRFFQNNLMSMVDFTAIRRLYCCSYSTAVRSIDSSLQSGHPLTKRE